MVKPFSRRHFFSTALALSVSLALPLGLPAVVQAETPAPARSLSPPVIHDNLAIYFVRGPSASGPVPLTLAEALQSGKFIVHETGNVNSLQVENTGNEPVFIQSGDMVKGGKQDRVLTVSLIVPPKSGKIPIDAFCVEQGRWSPRGREQAARFEASNSAMPSRAAKLAMKAPAPAASADRPIRSASDTSTRQAAVWQEVSRKQDQLARSLAAPVASAQSRTSLQLTLENEKLATARAAYATALRPAAGSGGDVIGYVFAINGKINSADVYASNALFAKMWPKMLDAAITEALGERPENDRAAAPAAADIEAFLAGAEQAQATQQTIGGAVELETRRGADAWLFDTRMKSGAAVHRNYLAAK